MPETVHDTPVMTLFAGPNGAGKSTLQELWSLSRPLGQIIDSDAFARELNLSDVAAGREAIRRVQICIKNQVSFSLETTLSGNLIFQQIAQARAQGFVVHLLYISLSSPFAHQKRVEQRVAMGGHAIPPVDVERRYYRSHQNLPRVIMLADYADIYTNGSKCDLIAKIEHGQIVEQATKKPLWAKKALYEIALGGHQ